MRIEDLNGIMALQGSPRCPWCGGYLTVTEISREPVVRFFLDAGGGAWPETL
jgi:hypothetical protein